MRESERELAARLESLRRKIVVAERGENKRIKDANKYIAKTLKNIARTSREQEKIQEKELEKLERFLGESFETLEEARSALGTQTRKATKREKLSEALRLRQSKSPIAQRQAVRLEREVSGRKLDTRKPAYTIRQLSELEHQQVIEFLSDKQSFDKVGLDYLQPNERITVSVPYTYIDGNGRRKTGYGIGRKVFKSWTDLRAYIIRQYFGDEIDTDTEDWLGRIEIIKFPTEYQYAIEKGRQDDATKVRRKVRQEYFKKRGEKREKKAYERGLKAGRKGRK